LKLIAKFYLVTRNIKKLMTNHSAENTNIKFPCK